MERDALKIALMKKILYLYSSVSAGDLADVRHAGMGREGAGQGRALHPAKVLQGTRGGGGTAGGTEIATELRVGPDVCDGYKDENSFCPWR